MKNTKELVKKLVKKYNTNNPFILSEKLDITVKYLHQNLVQDGFYTEIDGKNYIFIREDLPIANKTFVCARELGRYLIINQNKNHITS
ncbi:hypothetical protein SFC08_02045 [Lysinibacillus halotolerans]